MSYSFLKQAAKYFLPELRRILAKQDIDVEVKDNRIKFSREKKTFRCTIAGEDFDFSRVEAGDVILPLDRLITAPGKIAALAMSKLGLNDRLFARNCRIEKVDKKTAVEFFDRHHLMNSTGSAYNLGLYSGTELVALAAFSKGRRLDRLPVNERSFELIRFCSRSGTTVSGGLSRLIRNFCIEKKAADIMSYVDRQLSDGSSFIKAGFRKAGETDPHYFLVHRKTFARIPVSDPGENYDKEEFYLTRNLGNIKLLYHS